MNIIKDSRTLSPEELSRCPHAQSLGLDACLSVLASPDTGRPLQLDSTLPQLSDGENCYGMREGLPILIPTKLQPYFTDRLVLPLAHYKEAYLQYYLLATIKQSGEINAASSEVAAQKHFYRMSRFLSEAKGLTLDVGCDDPRLSASFFSPDVSYVGLDPFCLRASPFRVIGVGEHLPFLSESLDNVVFNTSLDHILDWRLALKEAKRVLRKGGSLYLASYIWTDSADLLGDSVHFHHFRYYEILGALQELQLSEVKSQIYESPKGDSHRHGLYLQAVKS